MTLVLHAVAPAERLEWLAWWEATGREPFAHPDFVELFSRENETALALVLQQADGSALLPLVRRQVPGGGGRRDAVSPYGYGGPFVTGQLDADALGADLVAAFEEQELVSVFLRLSLDADVGSSLPQAMVVERNDNIVVDLHRPEAQIWHDYEHKVRKNVNKALRAGCTVVRQDETDWVAFVKIYTGTMNRRAAASWYHFDESFFRAFATRLPGCFTVFSVLDAQGTTVSAELVLQSDRHLYSFLGGTLREAFPMAPNDLLKHEVVRYGIQTGRRSFVLGGGVERGDGIFRYKRSFDPTGVVPFRTMEIVSDSVEYERLSGASSETGSGFFPAYRAGG